MSDEPPPPMSSAKLAGSPAVCQGCDEAVPPHEGLYYDDTDGGRYCENCWLDAYGEDPPESAKVSCTAVKVAKVKTRRWAVHVLRQVPRFARHRQRLAQSRRRPRQGFPTVVGTAGSRESCCSRSGAMLSTSKSGAMLPCAAPSA